MEAFLCTMEKSVEEMNEEAFQKHIQALAIRRLDKPKKLSAECAKYWGEIISQQYNFDRGAACPTVLFTSQTLNYVSNAKCTILSLLKYISRVFLICRLLETACIMWKVKQEFLRVINVLVSPRGGAGCCLELHKLGSIKA